MSCSSGCVAVPTLIDGPVGTDRASLFTGSRAMSGRFHRLLPKDRICYSIIRIGGLLCCLVWRGTYLKWSYHDRMPMTGCGRGGSDCFRSRSFPTPGYRVFSDLLDTWQSSLFRLAGGIGNRGQANLRTGGWNVYGEAGDIAVTTGCCGLLRLQPDDIGAVFNGTLRQGGRSGPAGRRRLPLSGA